MTYGGDDDFPPPPPELLQQQYLYGTVPDSRQSAVQSNMAFPQGQVHTSYAPGVGDTATQQPQRAEVSVIPASTKPLEVIIVNLEFCTIVKKSYDILSTVTKLREFYV